MFSHTLHTQQQTRAKTEEKVLAMMSRSEGQFRIGVLSLASMKGASSLVETGSSVCSPASTPITPTTLKHHQPRLINVF